MKLSLLSILTFAATAFAGSYVGANVLYMMPVGFMRPLVIVLLVVMLVYTWFRPQFGATDANRPITRNALWTGMALGTVIGFYDGFFGPGTGSFLLFLFVRVFHFDFLRATACAKVWGTATFSRCWLVITSDTTGSTMPTRLCPGSGCRS